MAQPSGGRQPWQWLWLLAPLLVLFLLSVLSGLHGGELSYSEFKQLAHAAKLNDLVQSEQMVAGTLKADDLAPVLGAERAAAFGCRAGTQCRFSAVRVADPGLVGELEQAGISYAGQRESNWLGSLAWWLPLLLLFGLPRMLGKAGGLGEGGLLGIGKSHARVYMAAKTGVTFADVAGIDEAKEELSAVLFHQRFRIRGNVRRRRRGAGARPVRPGRAEGAQHHLHR